VGLTQFKLDVPDGEYEVTLHFSELEAVPAGEQLVYNLSKDVSRPTRPGSRSFDVLLNGQPVLVGVGEATYLEPLRAVRFKLSASAQSGRGITVDFKATRGEAVLNGIQVRRVY